jgi:hypothetical protein
MEEIANCTLQPLFARKTEPEKGGWVRPKPGLDDLDKRRKCLDLAGPVHSLVPTAAMPYHFMTTDTPAVTEFVKSYLQ